MTLFSAVMVPQQIRAQNNALWIWNTRQIIDQPAWNDSLLAVARQFKISTLFLYFPYQLSDNGDSLSFYKKEKLIAFLRWAKGESFAVHAVAGEPEWALPGNHPTPLMFAREVAAMRKEYGVPDGIQFDIEPYLLLPFSLPQTKQQLIRDWITVVWKIGKVVRQEQGLTYGIAVPFWMEDNISVDGIVQPIGLHLTYLTDYVAVMSYRNQASGPASVISFSEQERKWARQAHRKVYIGIETQRMEGSTSHFVCEVDPETFSQRIVHPCGGYSNFHFKGWKISALTIDDKMFIGVSGGNISDDELRDIREGVMKCFSGKEITVTASRLKEYIRETGGEWESAVLVRLQDGSGVMRMKAAELKRSTMFNLTQEELMFEYSLLLRHAQRHPEIEGIAVHDLKSILKFLRR
jgi:hypothetical protein